MAKEIGNLNEIGKYSAGDVIFYKEGAVLRMQCDNYDVGVVVQEELHNNLVTMLKRGLAEVVELINSEIGQTIIKEFQGNANKKSFDWSWITNPPCPQYIHGNFGSQRVSEGKGLIVATMPVPENYNLAKKFADEVERQLKRDV